MQGLNSGQTPGTTFQDGVHERPLPLHEPHDICFGRRKDVRPFTRFMPLFRIKPLFTFAL